MESIKRPPLGKQAAELIRNSIIEGVFAPGTTLLQEELAERFGVSRIPIREALQILEREGLIVVQANRRVTVATISDEEIADDYSVRALIEAEAARRAALVERREDHLHNLQRAHRQAEEAHLSGGGVALVQAFRDFHRTIWEASGSRQLLGLAHQLWTGLAPHTPAFLPQQYDKSTAEHERIMQAVVAGDAQAARDEMEAHILRTSADLITYRNEGGEAPPAGSDVHGRTA